MKNTNKIYTHDEAMLIVEEFENVLIKDKIQNGYTYENGKLIPIMEDGLYYDQYYVDNIKETIDIITTVLETTDFETQMIYYVSSW